jgi:hypothetical protein
MHFDDNMENNNDYRSHGSQNFEEILFEETKSWVRFIMMNLEKRLRCVKAK